MQQKQVIKYISKKNKTFLPIKGTLSEGGMLSATMSWNTVKARRTVTPRETFSPESAGR